MQQPMKQNLMPNLKNWVLFTLALIVLFTIGLFEHRTKFTLQDGTIITGSVKEEDPASVTVVRASGYEQTLLKSDIKDRSAFNIEVDLNLGLDLRGGTTLTYHLPIAETDPDKKKTTLEETVSTFRRRLDSFGVKELSVVSSGTEDIMIELPGITMEESLAYEQVIQRLGTLSFHLVAANAINDNLDVAAERTKVKTAWDAFLAANPGASPKSFDASKFDVKGVSGRTYRWFPYSEQALAEGKATLDLPLEMLEIDPDPTQKFEGDAISGTFQDLDSSGRPGLGFSIRADRAKDFGRFTGDHLGRRMAIVLDGKIHSAPNLNGKITDRGIIEGGATGFKTEELQALLAVFKSGSLKVTPTLMSKATIGPSLGEASIRRGMIAGIVASVLVVVFTVWYYGFIGILGSITLIFGIYFLVGGLGFLAATLTMPGIAGIVLTVGMAIDQNILINERIREERQKGKTIPQSVKNGFERAFVTIFDAQATTFLTGLILYAKGTGPIKGFAVTLMLGIIVTMYAAIVGQKLLFAIGLERGWFKELNLRHAFKNANINFSSMFRAGFIGSTVAAVLSLVFFAVRYDHLRGLDFSGGFQTRVRLVQAMTQSEVETAMSTAFESASVVAMKAVEGGSIGTSGEGYDYQIKVRADRNADAADTSDPRKTYIERIEKALGGKLVAAGFENLHVDFNTDTQRSAAKFKLNFDRPVAANLVETRLKERVAVTALSPTGEASSSSFDVELGYGTSVVEDQVRADVSGALSNMPGGVKLSDPMPESQFIGAKVGKELRNSAIIAMFLAILGIMLYVRIRFDKMIWGVAAIIALVHDVCVCLGAMTLGNLLGLIDVELDLVTIGSILTLIGYSINDTIVVFDRIRENQQRTPTSKLADLVNPAINQTLSRTVVTSMTVFIAVLVLFVVNYGQRNVLEGFAFIMLVGVIVGTYSSIFIASPLLAWIHDRKPSSPATPEAVIVSSK